MQHNDKAYAYMLLTLPLTAGEESVVPLTSKEVANIAGKLDINDTRGIGQLIGLEEIQLMNLLSIGSEEAYRIRLLLDRNMPLAKLIEDCISREIDILTPFGKDYPARLVRLIGVYNCPVLFTKGNVELLKGYNIGINGIGGIRTTEEVKQGLRRFAGELARNEFGLISQDVPGACRYAVREMLAIDGRTVLIAQAGISACEQEMNREMADKMEHNLVIGLCHPDRNEDSKNTALRTRTLFALSQAAFVLSTDGRRGEQDAARQKLCDDLYVMESPECEANDTLLNKGFRQVRDMGEFSVPAAAQRWRRSDEYNQLSFL
ncbi:MAG: DNA-processing protein DprA [Clostridiales bacterium]|nr:DNA-processing protein DprA [Clostridiales bacterium]